MFLNQEKKVMFHLAFSVGQAAYHFIADPFLGSPRRSRASVSRRMIQASSAHSLPGAKWIEGRLTSFRKQKLAQAIVSTMDPIFSTLPPDGNTETPSSQPYLSTKDEKALEKLWTKLPSALNEIREEDIKDFFNARDYGEDFYVKINRLIDVAYCSRTTKELLHGRLSQEKADTLNLALLDAKEKDFENHYVFLQKADLVANDSKIVFDLNQEAETSPANQMIEQHDYRLATTKKKLPLANYVREEIVDNLIIKNTQFIYEAVQVAKLANAGSENFTREANPFSNNIFRPEANEKYDIDFGLNKTYTQFSPGEVNMLLRDPRSGEVRNVASKPPKVKLAELKAHINSSRLPPSEVKERVRAYQNEIEEKRAQAVRDLGTRKYKNVFKDGKDLQETIAQGNVYLRNGRLSLTSPESKFPAFSIEQETLDAATKNLLDDHSHSFRYSGKKKIKITAQHRPERRTDDSNTVPHHLQITFSSNGRVYNTYYPYHKNETQDELIQRISNDKTLESDLLIAIAYFTRQSLAR
jgi:hypothetical protein